MFHKIICFTEFCATRKLRENIQMHQIIFLRFDLVIENEATLFQFRGTVNNYIKDTVAKMHGV